MCGGLGMWAGYALSIFIPISFVCVVPYEAVRWVMIGLATLSSGLFLLLNFRGPIFDVAGAKCAPAPACMHAAAAGSPASAAGMQRWHCALREGPAP